MGWYKARYKGKLFPPLSLLVMLTTLFLTIVTTSFLIIALSLLISLFIMCSEDKWLNKEETEDNK